MNRRIIVFLGIIVVSCGCDSDDDTANPTAMHDEKAVNLDYNTFAGLLAENPCNDKLNGIVAHISENKTDYVCSYDKKKDAWNWNSLQDESLEVLNSSSSLRNDILTSSSLASKMIDVSSSDEIKSVSELAGTSCAIELYKDSDEIMSYMAQGLVFPIEGTSSSVKCLKNKNDEWVWTIVENDNQIKSSSSSSFVFGEFKDTRDGQVYKTVGVRTNVYEKIWFAEDLKFQPYVSESQRKSLRREPYKCESNYCEYMWEVAMENCKTAMCLAYNGEQGLCPDGWLIGDILDLFYAKKQTEIDLISSNVSYWSSNVELEEPAGGCFFFKNMFYYRIEANSNTLGEYKLAYEDIGSFPMARLRCYKEEKIPPSMSIIDLN